MKSFFLMISFLFIIKFVLTYLFQLRINIKSEKTLLCEKLNC